MTSSRVANGMDMLRNIQKLGVFMVSTKLLVFIGVCGILSLMISFSLFGVR
jgi:hypothetical protein